MGAKGLIMNESLSPREAGNWGSLFRRVFVRFPGYFQQQGGYLEQWATRSGVPDELTCQLREESLTQTSLEPGDTATCASRPGLSHLPRGDVASAFSWNGDGGRSKGAAREGLIPSPPFVL